MTSWREFTQLAPDLAAYGAARFGRGVAYLATIRPDGGPRVHPVTPILGEELFLFMEPASPKGHDLRRDPRFTLHCTVEDSEGGEGEFYVRGRAVQTDDPAMRQAATAAASYTPADRYILFILRLDFAFANQYAANGPFSRRWSASK